MRISAGLLGLFITLIAMPAPAHDFTAGSLKIQHPWARATAASARNGGVYLAIDNGGAAADRLISVSTPAADRAETHVTLSEDGVMKMRQVTAIDLAPGTRTELKPGGLHIMLLGLKGQLKHGEKFPLTLTFEKAGTIEVVVVIDKPGAMIEHQGHDQPR